MEDGYPNGTTEGFLKPYVHGDWRNAQNVKYKSDELSPTQPSR